MRWSISIENLLSIAGVKEKIGFTPHLTLNIPFILLLLSLNLNQTIWFNNSDSDRIPAMKIKTWFISADRLEPISGKFVPKVTSCKNKSNFTIAWLLHHMPSGFKMEQMSQSLS